jgi:hypothetical protein
LSVWYIGRVSSQYLRLLTSTAKECEQGLPEVVEFDHFLLCGRVLRYHQRQW